MDFNWLILAILGAIGSILYKAWQPFWRWLKSQFVVEIQIRHHNARCWIEEWIADEIKDDDSYRILEAEEDALFYELTERAWQPKNKKKRQLGRRIKTSNHAVFFVGYGSHLFWYKARPIWITYGMEGEGENQSSSWTIRSVGRDASFLKQLVLEAESMYRDRRHGGLSLYSFDPVNCAWYEMGVHGGRSLSSVILKAGDVEEISADMLRFINNAEHYSAMDVPYRRGYLLYGPPGCGKSSLVKAIATHFDMDLYILSLSASNLTDAGLQQAMSKVPDQSIMLLEDIDAAFANRAVKSDDDDSPKLGTTLSGLLNAIDGVAAGEGRILIMTTNYADKLDGALIRSGRIDARYYLGPTDDDMASRMFNRFFPDSTYATAFGKKAAGATPADLQAYLMKEWVSDEEAYRSWRKE